MPINAHPEYIQAEKEYNNANTDEEKLAALEQMTRTMPKHKSAEAFRKNIRTRYKKLKQDIEKKTHVNINVKQSLVDESLFR